MSASNVFRNSRESKRSVSTLNIFRNSHERLMCECLTHVLKGRCDALMEVFEAHTTVKVPEFAFAVFYEVNFDYVQWAEVRNRKTNACKGVPLLRVNLILAHPRVPEEAIDATFYEEFAHLALGLECPSPHGIAYRNLVTQCPGFIAGEFWKVDSAHHFILRSSIMQDNSLFMQNFST